MTYLKEFLQGYAPTVLGTILTAIAAYIGAQIKRIYEKRVTDDTKKKVVETCVKAAEQLYHDLSGEEKKQKAVESILQILESKGITISPIEIDMLIESTVAAFNYTLDAASTCFNYTLDLSEDKKDV